MRLCLNNTVFLCPGNCSYFDILQNSRLPVYFTCCLGKEKQFPSLGNPNLYLYFYFEAELSKFCCVVTHCNKDRRNLLYVPLGRGKCGQYMFDIYWNQRNHLTSSFVVNTFLHSFCWLDVFYSPGFLQLEILFMIVLVFLWSFGKGLWPNHDKLMSWLHL